MPYIFRDRSVLPETRAAVLDHYPVLAGDDPHTVGLRRFMQYCLFAAYRYGTAALIAPFGTVATLFAVHPKQRGFRAIDYLNQFEDEVLPLNITKHDRGEGMAREVRPDIEPEIIALKERELDPEYRSKRVHFVTGEPVSPKRHWAEIREYEERVRAESRSFRPDHPARDLLDWLNEQSPRTFRRTISAKWEEVCSMAFSMPQATVRERNRREAAFRVLEGIEEEDCRATVYAPSKNTVRVHAAGYNVHLLPRKMRRVALSGGIALDLKACQLAVVAKLWDLPKIQDFLREQQAGGPSIWDELHSSLGLDTSAKPILKSGTYASTYGMGKKALLHELARGNDLEEGINPEQAVAFLNHPLIKQIWRGRRGYYQRIRDAGGARDAFGHWISTDHHKEHQIAAQQAQSYELRLMMAILPVLQADSNISVLSWLHDGVTVKVHDRRKIMRKVRQLREAVEREADNLGMHTYLEVEM
ncbi:MAG: hypothetical protein ACO1SX_23950 [Actinomycetota bacterium]